MKRNATAAIFLTLLLVYLLNASILISSLDVTQLEPLFQQHTQSSIISHGRQLSNDVGVISRELPIYTSEMAAQAIRPALWTCGAKDDSPIDSVTNQRPMFAFVHIYKTAGSTIRNFFQTYAYICRKGWMCLIGCTRTKSSSIQSELAWEPCKIKNVIDRHRTREEDGMKNRRYHVVNNTVLRDNIDVLGGHFRIGTSDFILRQKSDVHPTRHILFLRDPMDRFISGILYERRREHDGFADIVELIKKRVRGSRASDDYWEKSLTYLLTPLQAEEFVSMKSEMMTVNSSIGLTSKSNFAQIKARTAIHNLAKYNAIVGMTEYMDQSMEILKLVLLTNAGEEHVGRLEQYTNNTRSNESEKGGITTSSVRNELEKDQPFMSIFKEYVKYEKMISDYAMKMHLMQYEQVVKARM